MSRTSGIIAQHRRRGHTLTEMLVVLAILGVTAGAVAPALLEAREQDPVRDVSRALVELLRGARAAAADHGSVITVVVDPATGRAWMSETEDGPLVEDSLTMSLAESLARARHAGTPVAIAASRLRLRWTFAPSGLALGEPVVVRDAVHAVLVSVQPWTGEVHAHSR